MAQQAAAYFDRFYQLVLREHLNDPILHSEWLYFLSMFRNNSLEHDRLELYLGILANERKKKTETKPLPPAPAIEPKQLRNSSKETSFSDLKLEKRQSQSWKQAAVEQKLQFQPHNLKRLSSLNEDSIKNSKKSNQNEEKSHSGKYKIDPQYVLPTQNTPNYPYNAPISASPMPDLKQTYRNRKIAQISRRLLKVFQGNSQLRG